MWAEFVGQFAVTNMQQQFEIGQNSILSMRETKND